MSNATENLTCIVVTPEETVVETTADFVVAPLFDGEIGVGLKHSPMIGRLGFGELRLKSGDDVQRFYVDGGFIQVSDNQVSVMTNRAMSIDKIDATSAEEQLAAALAKPASGPDAMALRQREIDQARGQIRVASKAK